MSNIIQTTAFIQSSSSSLSFDLNSLLYSPRNSFPWVNPFYTDSFLFEPGFFYNITFFYYDPQSQPLQLGYISVKNIYIDALLRRGDSRIFIGQSTDLYGVTTVSCTFSAYYNNSKIGWAFELDNTQHPSIRKVYDLYKTDSGGSVVPLFFAPPAERAIFSNNDPGFSMSIPNNVNSILNVSPVPLILYKSASWLILLEKIGQS